MNIFQKFQMLIAGKKKAKETLTLLADSLAETNDLFMRYEGIHAQTIQFHLESAESFCKNAFRDLKDDEEARAMKNARNGLVHLHIAQLLGSGKEPPKVELKTAPDTTEGALYCLIQKIAKVKLIVEYGDLHIEPNVQDALRLVMKIFDSAVTDLRNWHVKDARREAGAAMVALHWTVCLTEMNNPGQDLSALKAIDFAGSASELKACELASKIAECRTAMAEMQTVEAPEVSGHLMDAEEKFMDCIENLIDGDPESITLDCRSGKLDLQLAIRASKEISLSSGTRPSALSREELGQFKQDAQRILRLVEYQQIDCTSLRKHLEAAEDYFVRAHRCLDQNELNEAERLARAAHLDLDFSWQIANTVEQAQYKQDL